MLQGVGFLYHTIQNLFILCLHWQQQSLDPPSNIDNWVSLLIQSVQCYQGQSLENHASILLSQSNSGPQLSLIELISNLASRLGVQSLSLLSSGNWQFQQLVAYTCNIALEWVLRILIVWIPPKCLSRVHDLEAVFILVPNTWSW